MSVQQIEDEIAKLAPNEMKRLAAWITGKISSQAVVRPPVGKVTSAPVQYTPDAFAPLTGQEMEEFGFA